MYIRNLLVFASIFPALSACERGPENSYQEGTSNCSSSFVGMYNNVISELGSVKRLAQSSSATDAAIISQLERTLDACNAFYKNHSGVSCKAEVNFQEKWINSNEHRSSCDAVSEALRKIRAPAPAPTPAPRPAPVAETPSACNALITDEYKALLAGEEKIRVIRADTGADAERAAAELRDAKGDVKVACDRLALDLRSTQCTIKKSDFAAPETLTASSVSEKCRKVLAL
jgi:hypothetical protein